MTTNSASSQPAPGGAVAEPTPHQPLYVLRYRLTRADIAAYERLPRELVGRDKLFLLGPALLGGLLWGVFEKEIGRLLPVDPHGPWAFPLVVSALIAFAYGSSALMLTVRTWWRIRSARLPSTETVVEAWDDHFTVTEDARTRAYAWEMVVVGGNDSHVFQCVSPREAVILPLRAFNSPEHMRSFLDFAEYAGRDPDEDGEDDEGDDAPQTDARSAGPGHEKAAHDHDTKGARA